MHKLKLMLQAKKTIRNLPALRGKPIVAVYNIFNKATGFAWDTRKERQR